MSPTDADEGQERITAVKTTVGPSPYQSLRPLIFHVHNGILALKLLINLKILAPVYFLPNRKYNITNSFPFSSSNLIYGIK